MGQFSIQTWGLVVIYNDQSHFMVFPNDLARYILGLLLLLNHRLSLLRGARMNTLDKTRAKRQNFSSLQGVMTKIGVYFRSLQATIRGFCEYQLTLCACI